MDQVKTNQNNYTSTGISPMSQINDPLHYTGHITTSNEKEQPSNTINMVTIKSKSSKRKKIIATFLGMLILIIGLGAGVYLSQQSQNIREKAAKPDYDKCDDVMKYCNPDGTCSNPHKVEGCLGCCRGNPSTPAPNSTRPDICISTSVDKKTIKPGETITISSRSKEPANYFMYAVYNMDNLYPPPPENNPKPVCVKNGGDITTAQDICPPGSHLLIFEDPNKELRTEGKRTIRYEDLFVRDELTGKIVSNLSITAYFQKEGEPISVPKAECVVRTISSQKQAQTECLDIKAYIKEGEDWILLDQNDLSSLKPGNKIYLTVTGKAENPNKFTKAKFRINNNQPVEVLATSNTKRSDSEELEIFYEYTIPASTTSFSVKAAIYYEGIGWIGSTE